MRYETNSKNTRRIARRIAAGAIATAALTGVHNNPAQANESTADKPGKPIVTKIATFNIIGSNHVRQGRAEGGVLPKRMRHVAALINQSGAKLIGLQETEDDQKRMLKHGLLEKRFAMVGPPNDSNPIIYDKTVFDLENKGVIYYSGTNDPGLKARTRGTTVNLRDRRTGEVFNWDNTHWAPRSDAGGSDRGGALKREATADKLFLFHYESYKKDATIQQLSTHDGNYSPFYRAHPIGPVAPVSNDAAYHGNRNRMPECDLTKVPEMLQSSYTLAHGLYGHCPPVKHTEALAKRPDWIYLTPRLADYAIQDINYQTHIGYEVINADGISDHDMIVATQTLQPVD